MRILFLGDIVGRSGREAVISSIPMYRKKLDINFVIVNGENSAGGFGITSEICNQFFESGVDVITGGNHSWDQQEIIKYIDKEPRLLRPINHHRSAPGRGESIYTTSEGKKVMVINALGQVFMNSINSPFEAIDNALKSVLLGSTVDAIFIDFHAEATSEKMAMGHFLDGRVSAVIGSHQQIPTADGRIFRNGTAYQTDAGMCGDYESIIGMEKNVPLSRFLGKVNKMKMTPALGDATICGVVIDIDDYSGLAKNIYSIRQGGCLNNIWPE
ncbi:TIGR00282 family metallophosphoesterase [Alphaproteobacteria bacterium]|nr:TIGR00282 family metallophosphoesterase [Alphaproteobacteria bacterium]